MGTERAKCPGFCPGYPVWDTEGAQAGQQFRFSEWIWARQGRGAGVGFAPTGEFYPGALGGLPEWPVQGTLPTEVLARDHIIVSLDTQTHRDLSSQLWLILLSIQRGGGCLSNSGCR